jgi:hypothetical protein
MKKIFSTAYRQDYLNGYSVGLNPFMQLNSGRNNEAFIGGFNSGRLDYERMNGCVANGIPQRIVTDKVLEDFLISGLVGLSADTDGYTLDQISIIEEWYQSGMEQYDPNESNCLFEILEKSGISIN